MRPFFFFWPKICGGFARPLLNEWCRFWNRRRYCLNVPAAVGRVGGPCCSAVCIVCLQAIDFQYMCQQKGGQSTASGPPLYPDHQVQIFGSDSFFFFSNMHINLNLKKKRQQAKDFSRGIFPASVVASSWDRSECIIHRPLRGPSLCLLSQSLLHHKVWTVCRLGDANDRITHCIEDSLLQRCARCVCCESCANLNHLVWHYAKRQHII